MTWVETGSGVSPIFLADMFFDGRVDIGEGADSTGDRDGCDFGAGIFQPLEVTGELGVMAGQLDAKGCRLGVDGMAAANADRVFVFQGAFLERGEQRLDIGNQNIGGLAHLHGEAGVEHV